MNVRYTYDKKTEENIKIFESYLYQYENILNERLANDNLSRDDFSRAYLSDSGRMSIVNQIIKIKEMSIPISIEFTGC